jgi:outer membrane protein TolC
MATIADSIANVQFRVARLQYTTGSLSYTDFLSVQQSKDDAVMGRVDALAKFWDNYYNLKRLMGP